MKKGLRLAISSFQAPPVLSEKVRPNEEGTTEKHEMRRWGDWVRGRRKGTKPKINEYLSFIVHCSS